MMNVTLDQCLVIIGAKEIEIQMLRIEIEQLKAQQAPSVEDVVKEMGAEVAGPMEIPPSGG